MRSRAWTWYLAAAALSAPLLGHPARAQLLYSLGEGPTLRVIDAATSATVSSVPVTLPGMPVVAALALARHPTTGELWAMLPLGLFGLDPELVTIDRCTGVATSKGSVGTNFYGLAFDGAATLYTVSGLFEPVHSTLYTIGTGGSPDPAFVVTMSLGTHHALAFSPDDGLLYHGAPGLLESVNPTTLAITNVPFSGDSFAAIMGSLVYAGDGVLYAGGGGSGAFDRITTAGVVTNLAPLDHDSAGLALVGTDAPCPTTTTTSTSSSTTTTTLAGGCGPVPRPDCVAGEEGLLEIDERKPGRERLAASVRRLAGETGSAELGDPIGGASAYDTCVYDQAGTLVGALRVDRAGATCGSKPCWKPIKSIGSRYTDEQGSADGVVKLVVRGGAPGRGASVIRAANRAAAGMTSLPTGLAAALAANGSATIQVVVSDGACLAATLPTVRVADGMRFKARLR